MEKVKKILAPTDYSKLSCVGLRHALEMARNEGAEILIYHVISMNDPWAHKPNQFGPHRDLLAEQERILDKFLRDEFEDFINLAEVRQKVEMGMPHANIVEVAEREKIDMIVMSTHGRTGLDHVLLGSVAEKVVNRAPCPVLVIPVIDRKKVLAKVA